MGAFFGESQEVQERNECVSIVLGKEVRLGHSEIFLQGAE